MKRVIYIVEDEPDIAQLIGINLEKSGFDSKIFTEGKYLLRNLEKEKPDLIILDLMLPDMDGVEICKTIRLDPKNKNIPILIASAKDSEIDKILGLELGADDYLTKPFSPQEMIARIKAILRRSDRNENSSSIIIGNILQIETDKHEVTVEGEKIELTPAEFKLLLILAEKPGWVFSRDRILDYIWGYEKAVIDRTIDVHVKHLREKLKGAGDFIRNVRGIGYKIEV